jgi:hypothetical protein
MRGGAIPNGAAPLVLAAIALYDTNGMGGILTFVIDLKQ